MLKGGCEEVYRRYYQIGGITIQLESDLPITDATFQARFKPFQVDGPGDDTVVISHHFYIPDLFSQDLAKEVYRRPPWAIYRKDDSWIYLCGISQRAEDKFASQIVVSNLDYTSINIYNKSEKDFREGGLYELTLLPSDQILLARIFADRDGFYIHSSGAILDDKGFIFVGHSGAGKTTIAAMLKGKAEILCEDRIIVRRWPDGFRIHGTWSRRVDEVTQEVSLQDVSANSAPLRAIMFLEQARDNRLVPLDDSREIARRILACLIKPFMTADWWDKILTLGEKLIREVPCYILQFDKSGSVVDLLERL